jgi:hypothetical protein
MRSSAPNGVRRQGRLGCHVRGRQAWTFARIRKSSMAVSPTSIYRLRAVISWSRDAGAALRLRDVGFDAQIDEPERALYGGRRSWAGCRKWSFARLAPMGSCPGSTLSAGLARDRMPLRAALDLDSKPRAQLIRATPDGFDPVIRPHRRSRRRGHRPGDPGAWRQPIRIPQGRRSRRRRRRRPHLWRGDGDGRRNRPA